MSARLDIAGKTFGRLTAISAVSWGPTIWLCRCSCGTETKVKQGNLCNGHTQSCGCLKKDNRSNLQHGHTSGRSASRTFRAYTNAKNRCTNPKYDRYYDCGGRGIRMCDEWVNSFAAFLADMGECPAGLTIERQNNHGNYEPGNCHWASPAEQARNKRNNIWVEHEGQSMILKDFAAVVDVDYHALHSLTKYHGQTPQVIAERMRERRENVARIIKR